MTTISDIGAPAPGPAPETVPAATRGDHRGSWIPTWSMITTRFMELRKRRGLMIALIAVNVGIPVVFLAVRLITHAVDPKSYGPAGGYSTSSRRWWSASCTSSGSSWRPSWAARPDRSTSPRGCSATWSSPAVLAWPCTLARIPAGLAIVIAMVAVGYTIVCAVCVFAAPTQLNYDGVTVPQGLSRPALDSWAASHADEVICDFNFNGGAGPLSGPPPSVSCGNGQTSGPPPGTTITGRRTGKRSPCPRMSRRRRCGRSPWPVANQDYTDYSRQFTVPSTSLMFDVGLWIALEATIGFIVGLGLASLIGQRTVPVVLLIVLELILTPIFSRHVISHLLNVERGIVGVAMLHIEPGHLPTPFGGGGPGGGGGGGGGFGDMLMPESTLTASLVIVGWIVFWTAIGAWRMMTRDA